jgi:hypothetical protein
MKADELVPFPQKKIVSDQTADVLAGIREVTYVLIALIFCATLVSLFAKYAIWVVTR